MRWHARIFRAAIVGSGILINAAVPAAAGADGGETSSPSAVDSVAQDDQPSELHNGARHPAEVDVSRFWTDRDVPPLPVPDEQDAFFFVVFGDRTGGRPEGIAILEQAVRDTNLLEPDLVMTVGDLVEGYNDTAPWMKQMREFKGVMDDLLCPWFPVAGNHDIYFRGPNRPEGEHENNYETHFGPLWYAFKHKNCAFIVLYSDEGNPVTGEKSINKASAQVMTEEQLSWLRSALERSADAQHVFVFIHHPRWLRGGYGNDWEKVHAQLVAAGNVRAVFAGHIHRMRYDGPRDGIEYITLATTGGVQQGHAPQAGYLHHFHTVTVRRDQIAVASLPVGEVMDVRAITGKVSDEARQLARSRPAIGPRIDLLQDGSANSTFHATYTNTISRPIEITLVPDSGDSRWRFLPDHAHRRLEPGEVFDIKFRALRAADAIDATIRLPELIQDIDYLAEGARLSIGERRSSLPLRVNLPVPTVAADERVLEVDGVNDYLEVASDLVTAPDGPLTLECWFNADRYAERAGLVAKTENSEFGFFVNRGVPLFSLFLGDRYVQVQSDEPMLRTGYWHHIAGVYDGAESRLYVDGRLISTVQRSGKRRTNTLPLIIGADVDGRGRAVSHFDGRIDGVRLSTTARYRGERFEPQRRFTSDEHTVLLLNMDSSSGPWVYDASGRSAHPMIHGEARIVEQSAPSD